MKHLTRGEEIAWQDKVHFMQLVALEARRAANTEERGYREYIAQKYGAIPKAVT